MEQDLLVAIPDFLLADVIERVAQRLDGGFDRGFDVASFQLETVDLALDILEAAFRLVEQQLRAAAGVANDTLGLFFRGRFDVIGQPLRRHQRRTEVVLPLAVLVEHRLHARQVVAEAVGLA